MATTQPAPELTYQEYVALQLERSLAMKEYDPTGRARYLIGRLSEFLPARPGTRVLAVGCRNGHELDRLAEAGYPDVVGIDLHSTDPRIAVMDMQRMDFADGAFDAVYASHALEHALEPGRAAAEMARVTRPGGVIAVEVPVAYGRRGADLWDFQTPEGVAGLFPPCCGVVWSETGEQIGALQRVARLVLRVGGR